MNLNPQEAAKLADIAVRNATNIQAAVEAAYMEGLLAGALRAAQHIATTIAQDAVTTGNDDSDDTANTALTPLDISALTRMGIDPAKKMRERNSVYTIVGYKPSRWKFPIVVATQNGTRYKMSTEQVKALQRRA